MNETSNKRVLSGYLVQGWKNGKVTKTRDFPATPEGRAAAERLRKSMKTKRPGRPGQAVTLTPVFEDAKEAGA